MRIVSLLPSATESLFALGEWTVVQLRRLADRLDGGTRLETQRPASSFSPTSNS